MKKQGIDLIDPSTPTPTRAPSGNPPEATPKKKLTVEPFGNKPTTTNTNTPQDQVVEPTFTIELPSLGKLGYAKSVVFRPFKIQELKALAQSTSNLVSYFAKLRECLETCCVTPDFNLGEITLPDFLTVMLAMRLNSIDNVYEVIITCPNKECHKPFDYPVLLNSLECKDISQDFVEPYEVLPGLNIRLPRIGNSLELLTVEEVDNFELIRRALDITEDQMNELPAKVYKEALGWIIDNDYGYNTMVQTTCVFCSQEVAFSIPFRETFFL